MTYEPKFNEKAFAAGYLGNTVVNPQVEGSVRGYLDGLAVMSSVCKEQSKNPGTLHNKDN